MALEEVTSPMSRSRLTPVPRQSQDFDTKHVASLGAERTEILQRMAGASWLREGSSGRNWCENLTQPFPITPKP